jgi:hypothetical protein
MNYAPSLIPAATSDNLEDPIPADCALAKEGQKKKTALADGASSLNSETARLYYCMQQ